MSRIITLMIVACMLLGMPQLMNGMILTLGTDAAANATPLTIASQNMAKSTTDMLNVISYIAGIGFMFKAILAFKQYNEEGGYAETFNQSKEKEISTISLVKEEINAPKQITPEKFKFNLDFENKLLNNKLLDIEKVINSIISLPVLENDIENKVLVSSTQEKYVKQIHAAYVAIPKQLRDKSVKNSTATALAMEQLILLENGLIEIENELLNQQIKDLNIMSRFLKEKFPEEEKISKYITLSH